MAKGGRGGLWAILLMGSLWSGAPALSQEAATWTDPPRREVPAADRRTDQPAVLAPAPRPEAVTRTPAAAEAPKPVARDGRAGRAARSRTATRATRPPTVRRVAVVRRARIAARPRHTRQRIARIYDNRLAARTAPRAPYDGYDPRMMPEQGAYLVVRRRTVEFPDGRVLRVYRPYGEGGLYDE